MQKRRRKRRDKKNIAKNVMIPASVLLVGIVGWKGLVQGNFDPSMFLDNKKMKDNQILFDEEERKEEQGDNGNDDSEWWEQDHTSKEKLKIDQIPETQILFGTKSNTKQGKNAAVAQNSGGVQQNGAGVNDGGVVFVPGDGTNGPVIQIPGGAQEPNGAGAADGDGTSNLPGGDGTSNLPGTGQDGNAGDEEGKKPVFVDPDPTPSIPETDRWMGDVYDVPEQGISDKVKKDAKVRFFVVDGAVNDGNATPFYYGSYVSDWKALCAVQAYVEVDNDNDGTWDDVYRLTKYDENFKIGEHPEFVYDDFTVDFYFRMDKDSEWLKAEAKLNVCDFKLALLNGKLNSEGLKESAKDIYLYAEYDDTDVCFLPYYEKMLQPEDNNKLSQLFVGWSETDDPNGKPVINYQVTEKGRHDFYPLPMTEVPSEYGAELQFYFNFDDFTSPYNYIQMQTLTSWSGEGTMVIPRGIQNVSLMDWSSFGVDVVCADRIMIPDTLLVYDGFAPVSRKGFLVNENNPNFCSQDDLLLTKDKKTLLGIPIGEESITVPETVEDVKFTLPFDESKVKTTEIHFEGKTPPKLSESYSGFTFYVPAESYIEYLLAFGPYLKDNQIMVEGGEEADVVLENGVVFSKDRKTIYSIGDSVVGTYIAPEGVTTIAEHALDGASNLKTLILPESIESLESESLSGQKGLEIVVKGENPPAITATTFGDPIEVSVQVPEELYDTYLEEWSKILGQEKAEALLSAGNTVITEQNGFLYKEDKKTGEIIILKAPSDLTSFDENVITTKLDGKVVTEIAENAFANCTALTFVHLPESITKIGAHAYVGCTNLKAFVSDATDQIVIGDGAFDRCYSISFAVFNAKQATMEDGYNPWNIPMYIRSDAQSDTYPWGAINTYGKYELIYPAGQDGAYILYAAQNSENMNTVIKGSDQLSGEVELLAGTIEIDDNAFYGNGAITGVKNTGNLIRIGSYAFADTGVAGKIDFPASLHYLGIKAFYGCADITEVYFDGSGFGENGYEEDGIPDEVFYNCTGLQKVTFGSNCNIDHFGGGAFGGCTSLKEFTFPSSVKTIKTNVFEGSVNLEQVKFVDSSWIPNLTGYAPGVDFEFGGSETMKLTITPEENILYFMGEWRYTLQCYSPQDSLSEEELIRGCNMVMEYLDDAGKTFVSKKILGDGKTSFETYEDVLKLDAYLNGEQATESLEDTTEEKPEENPEKEEPKGPDETDETVQEIPDNTNEEEQP